jgi:P-type Cu+ transporter
MPEKLVTNCYHCGEKCDENIIQLNEKVFCCEGCKTVFSILNDSGLENYYKINATPGINQNTQGKDDFSYLQNAEIVQKLLQFSDDKIAKITLHLPQIHCSSCVWLLEQLHVIEKGIISSRIDFLKREAYITYQQNEIDLYRIVKLLQSIGYKPTISLNDANKKNNKKNSSSFYFKIGIAGFCFGNIMLLSFPEYLNIGDNDKQFEELFGYLNFILSLPVFLYSATDYYKSAWGSLKKRYFNIDVPITVGIITLFVRSTYDIFSGADAGYMDSLAGFVFFLLIGKWFQNYTYDSLSFDRDYKSYFPIAVKKIVGKTEENIMVENIKKNDIISVKNQELIPCDTILLSDYATIDYSFVTGESSPVEKNKGELIYAGGRNIGKSINLTVTKEVSQSYLTQLWNQAVFTKTKNLRNKNIINRVSQYFTSILFLIAFVSSIYWYFTDKTLVFNVFTAVLIVACPCALALTLPFAYGNTMRVLGKRGVYVKDADTIERWSKINRIVFDKTGTITINKNSNISEKNINVTAEELILIKSVLKHSTHPLSSTLFKFLTVDVIEIDSFEEFQGKGILGEVNGNQIKIGSENFITSDFSKKNKLETTIYVSINDNIKGYYIIKKQYRNNLSSTIAHLKKHYELFLLSGDNEGEKENLKNDFDEKNMLFNASPEDKLARIETLQKNNHYVCMIGDGLNDAGALKQSDVGIAIAEDINSFTPSCDVIMAAEKFDQLGDFFNFSKTIQKIIIWSFIFSFTYNIVGLYLAVSGILTPLHAAILMPLSSITVVIYVSFAVNFMASKKLKP